MQLPSPEIEMKNFTNPGLVPYGWLLRNQAQYSNTVHAVNYYSLATDITCNLRKLCSYSTVLSEARWGKQNTCWAEKHCMELWTTKYTANTSRFPRSLWTSCHCIWRELHTFEWLEHSGRNSSAVRSTLDTRQGISHWVRRKNGFRFQVSSSVLSLLPSQLKQNSSKPWRWPKLVTSDNPLGLSAVDVSLDSGSCEWACFQCCAASNKLFKGSRRATAAIMVTVDGMPSVHSPSGWDLSFSDVLTSLL